MMQTLIKLLNCTHIYLQKYCVIEIAVIVFMCCMNYLLFDRYFANLANLKEWDIAAIVGFHGATVGVIKYCLDSINADIRKS